MASHVLRSGGRSSPDAHFNLHFLFFFFSFTQEICTNRLLHYYINIVCSFFSTDKFDCYIEFIIIFNSMIHYHKLHSSTEAKHTCHSCLISNAVCLDILKLQVQTNSSWPGVNLGLILLGHKLFVCFPNEIIGIVQHC